MQILIIISYIVVEKPKKKSAYFGWKMFFISTDD